MKSNSRLPYQPMILVIILIIFLICFLGFIISAAIAGTRERAKGGKSSYSALEESFLQEKGFPEGFHTTRWTLVGRAIAGRTGAIIGALSGGTENSRVCTSIRIHILLRNNAFTSYDLHFLNETLEESSCAFQTRYAAAQSVMDLLLLAAAV